MEKKYRPCTCLYCGETLDRNTEEWTVCSGRYAHKECYEKEQKRKAQEQQKQTEEKLAKALAIEEEKNTRAKIHAMVKDSCGPVYSFMKVNRQIKQYLEEGKTMSGILGTVKYYYKIKKGDIAATNGGIAFVEWEYQHASEYYSKKKRLQKQIEETDDNLIEKYIQKQKEKPPMCPARYKTQKPKRITYFQLD